VIQHTHEHEPNSRRTRHSWAVISGPLPQEALSLCATALAAAKPPLAFLAPAHRIIPLRLAAAMSSSSPASPAIDFLTLCYRLKVSSDGFRVSAVPFAVPWFDGMGLWVQTTKREGWVRRGVQGPESIADHMYRMGVMALIAADLPGVDRDR
jgi:putative hydrolases of HD superfamily